ncbi:MAG: hypothetical protein AAB309_05240, partial [Deltaproteobacteria bacterium]
MRLGIVDLGTNSLRFDIYKIDSSKNKKLLYRSKEMIRLGEDLFVTKKISMAAERRVLKTLSKVVKIAEAHRTDKMCCYGTSPFREAVNAERLLKKIQKKTGLNIEVISGQHEADLIAKGILKSVRSLKPILLIDIGGGSTEFTLAKNGLSKFSISIPFGSLKLQDIYLKNHPPSQEAIEKMRRAIRKTLEEKLGFYRQEKIPTAIGSAGTIKALYKVTHSRHKKIDIKNLENFLKKIKNKKLPELKRLLKTEGRRGDIILAGTILLIECLH